jgi:phospho-N-acetylmuramoyl-pentapeptide-transferase
MVLLGAVTVGVGLLLQDTEAFQTSIYVPVAGWNLDLGILFYPFLFLVIAGTVNGANLTDGIDGLAAGTATIMLLTFLAIAGISWLRSGAPGERSEVYLDIATLAAALMGGTIGFLWYNAHPAEVFMGDTGSMALGGAIAGFAIVTRTEILLLLIGGIFLIEVLSLIIQVVSFKRTGRRVFLMAPIHHHFEMKAWSETKVMVRFWIVCAILCASGFALFYRDFLQFVER